MLDRAIKWVVMVVCVTIIVYAVWNVASWVIGISNAVV